MVGNETDWFADCSDWCQNQYGFPLGLTKISPALKLDYKGQRNDKCSNFKGCFGTQAFTNKVYKVSEQVGIVVQYPVKGQQMAF